MKITYAICVCTEARELNSLLAFLKKVKDPQDDINILVDTKNVTEAVKRVLEKFKDDIGICEREFCGSFAEHRNYHIEQCSGDYIFIIDADEMPREFFINNIRSVIEQSGSDLIYLPRINICPGYTDEWLKKCNFSVNDAGWINWPDYTGRIFKNDGNIKYGNKIHETLQGASKVVAAPANPEIALWHVKSVEKQDHQGELYDSII